jgi:hypothetical protein
MACTLFGGPAEGTVGAGAGVERGAWSPLLAAELVGCAWSLFRARLLMRTFWATAECWLKRRVEVRGVLEAEDLRRCG